MKRTLKIVVVLVSLALIGWSATAIGCAGATARDNVMVPTLVLTAPGVEADARSGIWLTTDPAATSTAIDAVFQALRPDNGGMSLVGVQQTQWPLARESAIRGIDHQLDTGQISPNLADMKRERLANFDEALAKHAAGGTTR